MKKATTVSPGDIYCDRERKTGKYFAYQLIEVMPDDITFLLLDYFAEELPGEKEVEAMKPFVCERWFFKKGSLDYNHSCSGKLPSSAVFVGNREPLVNDECNSYSSWPTGYDLVAEEEWMKIPEDVRRDFKAALSDTSEVIVGGIACKRSFYTVDDVNLSELDDFSELNKLPALHRVIANRYYPQLIPHLETRYTTTELIWKGHEQQELDFSRTYLQDISLDATGLQVLKLPACCIKLMFHGEVAPELRVAIPDEGEELTVMINQNVVPDLGLRKLRDLMINEADELDVAPVASFYPELKGISIWGKPGYIRQVASLAALKNLRRIFFQDLFGFTSEEFPMPGAWPDLQELWLESIPEEAGKAIRKAYKGKVDVLDICKLRKPEWLAENLDNPLRHWDGSEFIPTSKFKKTMKIYKETRREAIAVAQQYAADRKADELQKKLEQAAKDFTTAFNKLDHKSYFIETEEREDLCAAFENILDAAEAIVREAGGAFDREKIVDVMDATRDW